MSGTEHTGTFKRHLPFPSVTEEFRMFDPAAREKKSGLRGQDKQQGDLRDPKGGQGIARDERGQDQPIDKDRAQRTSGLKSQKEAAQSQPEAPGQPAGGE